MVLIIAFKATIAETVADRIKAQERIIINSSESGIKYALQEIKDLSPAKVLGMGVYSRKDTDMIRLELKCSSRFRNNGNNSKINIKSWLNDSKGIKSASGMGNSWCNKLSWEITNSFPDTPYSFLHIPKSFSSIQASDYIQEAIEES